MRFLSVAGLVLAASLAACGSDHHSHVHDGTSADGDDGLIKISFTTVPSPLAQGDNIITATVQDASGAALLGANVHPEIYQAGHEPEGETSTTEKGDGVYEITQVTFAKAGEYHITFHVTHHDKGIHDHATFRVVIK